ncbi:MAG TPA: hypothetical protein VGO11_21640 [Chthoniobacteraceae bacterium]|jgi:hypothetical protein|nr:hypothetical protein [Chthoniobacteraceae bacterium]
MHRWLILLLALTLPLAGKEDAPPKPIADSLITIVQDRAGRVWGWCRDHPGFSLVHLEGKEWVAHADVGPPGKYLRQLVPLPDGSLACVWFDNNRWEYAISIHRGDEPPVVLSTFGTRMWDLQILPRSDGSLLITGRGTLIVDISAEGEVKVIPIPDEFYRPTGPLLKDEPDFDAPVCALEDGEHRIWLWSYALNTARRFGRVVNFLEYKEGQVTRREVPGLEADAGVSAMVNHDATHLWYAKMGDGISSLDLKTMRSELLTHPLPARNGTDNVEYIEQIYCRGDERFALTCPRPTLLQYERGDKWYHNDERSAKRYYNETARSGRLLRYRAGTWDEIISGVDLRPHFGWRDRPLLLTSAGLLLASHESGPWLALRPGGKPPVPHGWETEFPLRSATAILPADAAHVWMCDGSTTARLLPIEPAREPARPPLQVSVLLGAIQMDAKGNGWGFRDEWQVSKWDGAQWTDFPVPKEVAISYGQFIWWLDDREQGWYLSKEGPAAILNLATSRWKVYASWEAAAQAQLPRAPREQQMNEPVGPPVYSETGQIAFFKRGEGLHYFNRREWKTTTMEAFAERYDEVYSAPWFRAGSCLSMHLGNFDYEYDDEHDRWGKRPDKDHYVPAPRAENPFPEGCPVKELIGVARYALGTSWILGKDRQLYKAVPGRTLPVFPVDRPNPFAHGEWLYGVEIDAKGGALVEQVKLYYEPHLFLYYHVPATMLAPIATARLEEPGGPFRVELGIAKNEPPAPDEVWFSWSLDDSPWHALQQKKEIVFPKLTDGPHRLEVRAYNAELGTQRTPTVLEWQTGSAPETLLQRWIAAFERPEFRKRLEALESIRRKGPDALPALHAAESHGSEEARNWVKKAIEQIESDRRLDTERAP